MFTGLVEEIGKVRSIRPYGGGLSISITASVVTADAADGDSINVNGVCQTVVRHDKSSFDVITVEETLKKTSLGKLKTGDAVNLERSMTLNKRLGGHFVMGHVDTAGKITSIKKLTASYLIDIGYPPEFSKYVINVGAIAVEGISLTIARFDQKSLSVSIIPHTYENTNLHFKKAGEEVNLEFDMLGKYVAKMLGKEEGTGISEQWLKQHGY